MFSSLRLLLSSSPGSVCFHREDLCALLHGCQIKWLKRFYRCKHLFISHPALPVLSSLRVTQCLIFIDSIFIKTKSLSPLFSFGGITVDVYSYLTGSHRARLHREKYCSWKNDAVTFTVWAKPKSKIASWKCNIILNGFSARGFLMFFRLKCQRSRSTEK